MKSIEERRASQRQPFREAVRYELKDPATFQGCVAYDLSETGIKLRLSEFIPLNTDIILNIQLDDGLSADCMGRIAWIAQIPHMEQYQAGIEFSEPFMFTESRERIQDYLEKAK